MAVGGELQRVRAGAAACAAALARLRADVEVLAAAQADLEAGLVGLEGIGQAPAAVPAIPVAVPATAASAVAAVELVAVADPGVAALCDHLENLHAKLAASGLGHDPADVLFLLKARAVISGAGAARTQRLFDILGFLDRLEAVYWTLVYTGLHGGIARARELIGACLPGFSLVTSPAAVPASPMRAPVVISTGITDAAGTVVRAAQVVTFDAGAAEMLAIAWMLAEEAGVVMARAYRKAVRDDCVRMTEDLFALMRPEAGRDEASAVRALLNLHTRVCEKVGPGGGQRALEWLKAARGWRVLTLEPGERFDPEKHDAKRFDRQGRSGSGKPTGTVIGLRQIGLLDTQGLPVQKCILVTAE